MARKITIEFLGKDVSAGSQASAVERRFGRMGTKLESIGRTAGKVLAGGMVLGTAAMVKMGQAAADDEAAQARLADAMRGAAGASDTQIAATERWIEAQGKALGIADDELRPALGRLVDATGDVEQAQRLAALAMDVSAGTGKSYSTVVEALVKAENGQIAGLSRLGIKTKDAAGNTKSLSDVTADLADLYKGRAASAAETTAGKQKKLQVALSELGESIGATVLPAMVKLSEIGLKMVNWVDQNRVATGAIVGTLVLFAATLKAVSVAMTIYAGLQKLHEINAKRAAAGQMLFNASMLANPVVLVVAGIAALAAALVVAYKKSETFRKIVNGAFTTIKRAGAALWGGIKLYFGLWIGAIKKVMDFTGGLKDRVVNGFTAVVNFIKGVPGKIRELGGKFKEAGASIMNKIIEGIRNAAGFIGNIASGIWNAVKGLLNQAIGKINAALEFKIDLPFGKSVSINPPDIPPLADGGIVTRPTLALVGEAGAEAVLPLSGRRGRETLSRMGGNGQVSVTSRVYLDGREIKQSRARYDRVRGLAPAGA